MVSLGRFLAMPVRLETWFLEGWGGLGGIEGLGGGLGVLSSWVVLCGGSLVAMAWMATVLTLAAQSSDFSPMVLIEQEKQQMLVARRQSARALTRSKKLQNQAALAKNEAEWLQNQTAALALRIQAAEADISASEYEVRLSRRHFAKQQAVLDKEQAPILALTTMLTRLSRQSPASIFVQPGNLSDLVHTRILLDSALPQIATRTANVRRKLVRLERLRIDNIAALAALEKSRDRLITRRGELGQLENKERMRARIFADSSRREATQALSFGEQARDISDLLQNIEANATLRDRLLLLPGPLPRPDSARSRAIFARSQSQAIPATKGSFINQNYIKDFRYRLPAVGRLTVGMGEWSDSGIRSRGLTIATQPGAQVVAPATGRIVFADDYRGYGKILIIDHGDGWLSLVTGMVGLSVAVGHTVEVGYPIGRVGAYRPEITVELRHHGRTVDMIPLLR